MCQGEGIIFVVKYRLWLSVPMPTPIPSSQNQQQGGAEQRECFASSDGKVLITQRREIKQNKKIKIRTESKGIQVSDASGLDTKELFYYAWILPSITKCREKI